MKRLGLRKNLIVTILAAGLIPLIVIGLYSTFVAREALEKSYVQSLESIASAKAEGVRWYFDAVRDQLLTSAHSHSFVGAMEAFAKAYKDIRRDNKVDDEELASMKASVSDYYHNHFGKEYKKNNEGKEVAVEELLNSLSRNALALQYYYISSNKNPLGSKNALNSASDASRYSEVHKEYHPEINDFLKRFGFYDIFLVDIDSGNVPKKS